MSIPQYKGKIKNTHGINSISYDRVAPGVTLPNEHLKGEELKEMSGEVIVYKLRSVVKK